MLPLTAHPIVWFGLVFLLLLLANLWVFCRREWEASHRAADYAQINYPSDTPTVRRWRIDRQGRLKPEIVWLNPPAQWQLLVNDKPVKILPGSAPWIELVGPAFTGSEGQTLEDCRQCYTLRPLPAGAGPDLEFRIARITRAFYRARGMRFPTDLESIHTALPVGRFKRHPVSYWVDDYHYLPAAKLAEADRIIREEMAIVATDSTLVRMEKIVRHLRTVWAGAGGVPKDDYRWQDPLLIYQELRAGSGKGWCTQNAQVFTFFANRAGVAARFVFGATVQSNRLVYTGHSWAECYLPDQGRWVYVDPQASIVAVFNRHGHALNSADLFQLCTHDVLDGITARIFKDWNWKNLAVPAAPGTAVDVPFSLVCQTAKKEFSPQTIIKYRRPPNVEDIRDDHGMLLKNPTFAWTNLKRYLFEPAPAYSFLPTDGGRVYLLRRALFTGLVISLGLLVAALV